MVMLGVGHYSSLAVAVEPDHTAGWKEGHRTAVVGSGPEVVVLHKVPVGEEDILAAVDSGCGEEVRMAAGVEDRLVVGGTDCVKEVRMVAVVVAGNFDYTGFVVHNLPAAAVTAAADLGHTLRVPHILEEVRQAHRSPAGVDTLVVGSSEEDIGLAGAADTLLPKSE